MRSITVPARSAGPGAELGGTPKIKTDSQRTGQHPRLHRANGTVEGKQLLEHFSSHPFGWSPDTLRYMVAALLLAAEIKLKVAGREVTVNGQQAIDALKTNQASSPSAWRCVMTVRRWKCWPAAERLTELCGEQVIPLEDGHQQGGAAEAARSPEPAVAAVGAADDTGPAWCEHYGHD